MSDDAESFKNGKYLTAKAKGVISVTLFIIFMLWVLGAFQQIPEPGNFFEKNEYSGTFYVYVYPYKDGVKNYKIPAQIDRVCVYDDGCGHGYNLNQVTFPNGGSPSFSDCHPDLHSKTLCTTDGEDGTDFYIQLTNERVAGAK